MAEASAKSYGKGNRGDEALAVGASRGGVLIWGLVWFFPGGSPVRRLFFLGWMCWNA